jgi:hypothetical protein
LAREINKWMLLVHIHSLGNLIKKGQEGWCCLFCSNGGANHFLWPAFWKRVPGSMDHHFGCAQGRGSATPKTSGGHMTEVDTDWMLQMALGLADPRVLAPVSAFLQASGLWADAGMRLEISNEFRSIGSSQFACLCSISGMAVFVAKAPSATDFPGDS